MSAAREAMRLKAVEEALKLVRDGMLVGLGSGTTIRLFIERLAEKVKSEGWEVFFVSTSYDTSLYASKLGLVEVPPNEKPEVAFDGADLVFPGRWVVKGLGGALFREKVLDYFARKYVIIADETKVRSEARDVLVPLEVHPYAASFAISALAEIRGVRTVSLRFAEKGKLGPVITDNGNFLVDVVFSEIKEPEKLEAELASIPGVMANGIFAMRKPSKIFIGTERGVQVL